MTTTTAYRFVTAPDHVVGCDLGPATVLINYRTGDVHTLIGPSARWWADLAASGDTDTITTLDPPKAGALLDQLHAAGLLTSTARPRPWPPPRIAQPWRLVFGTREAPAAHTPASRAPGCLVIVAGLALALTVATKHLGPARTGMWRLLRLLAWASRRATRPANPTQAEHAVHAVRRAGLVFPGRAACLEESVAAALTLAALRLGVTWCHGVTADPIGLHAWIESTDAGPVAEPSSTRHYTILRTIPERPQGGGQP
jgi:hypothetical protein